eukprot:CAMPEP_0196726826 /NCGR_PEP_ID=MMETSP1091-20130531/7975_1 /TAXON_ID=302021 /ORGANISM="Rhodomonas sp., Strain CCMP768" /LENGTH=131 /DNA_ID=CAMNT_0042069313 /DNA_START=82 /DNA_END=477 /DNA_ORIENTATION=+
MASADISQAFTGPMHGSLGEFHGFSAEGMSRLGAIKDRREMRLLQAHHRPTCIVQSECDENSNSVPASNPPHLRVHSDSESSVVSDGLGFSWIPVGGSTKEDTPSKEADSMSLRTNSMGFSSIPVGAPPAS